MSFNNVKLTKKPRHHQVQLVDLAEAPIAADTWKWHQRHDMLQKLLSNLLIVLCYDSFMASLSETWTLCKKSINPRYCQPGGGIWLDCQTVGCDAWPASLRLTRHAKFRTTVWAETNFKRTLMKHDWWLVMITVKVQFCSCQVALMAPYVCSSSPFCP